MNKCTVFFLLVAVMPISVYSQNNQSLYTFPFGVEAYTFRKSFPIDVIATLDTIKQMGFTEIEGSGGI